MPIHDLCFRNLVTISRDASLEAAARKMKAERVGALVVTDSDQKVTGILTDRDIIIDAVADGMPMSTKVSTVMSRDVLQVPKNAGVAEVIEKMEEREVRRAVVVDREGKFCGLISSDDLLQLLGTELNGLGRLVSHQLTNAA